MNMNLVPLPLSRRHAIGTGAWIVAGVLTMALMCMSIFAVRSVPVRLMFTIMLISATWSTLDAIRDLRNSLRPVDDAGRYVASGS